MGSLLTENEKIFLDLERERQRNLDKEKKLTAAGCRIASLREGKKQIAKEMRNIKAELENERSENAKLVKQNETLTKVS